MKSRKQTRRLIPRMRVLCGADVALGPGKADLLALIGETSSIREAAKNMGMSYMRAWTLIKTMNACFREPVVIACRGGKYHGGAALTETGRMALELYRALEVQSVRACVRGDLAKIAQNVEELKRLLACRSGYKLRYI